VVAAEAAVVAEAGAIIVAAIGATIVGKAEVAVEAAFMAVGAIVVVGDSPRSLKLMNKASPLLAVVSLFLPRVGADLGLLPRDGSIRRFRAVALLLPNLPRPERRL